MYLIPLSAPPRTVDSIGDLANPLKKSSAPMIITVKGKSIKPRSDVVGKIRVPIKMTPIPRIKNRIPFNKEYGVSDSCFSILLCPK